ncbi:MAG: purine-binding chemotaxis protein CheW [Calditrichaeota bacterium]|nr:MAG: purine-binding chemotaxis protein CheW [Calditrichota bacterium]
MQTTNGRNAQEIERFSIFELSGKLFGLDIIYSREVIPLPRFTPLPNSDEIFYGVFNNRGEIFPLVDISPILGLPAKQIQSDDMVILVEKEEGFCVGVLVDKIHSIIYVEQNELKSPRGLVSRTMENFLNGLIINGPNMIHILDIESLFKTKQLLAHY